MGNAEAEAYDAWADHYDIADADRAPFIAFYGSLLGPDTRSLLELGCGTGTILAAMAARLRDEHHVVPDRVAGVDLSAGMLRVAAARHPGIEWIHGDICKPPLHGRFDLVTSCFNTLQHLLDYSDLLRALHAARDCLADEGRFAFDIYLPNVPYLSIEASDRLARAFVDEHGRALEIREDARYDADGRVLHLNWRLVLADDRAAPPLAATSYRLRQYFPAEIERALVASGLEIVERFGDFDRSPFGPGSRKQIVVCRRA